MPVKELIHGQTVYPQGRKLEVSSKHLEWTQAAARALNTHDALFNAAVEMRDWLAGGDVPRDLFAALCAAIEAAGGGKPLPGPWMLEKEPEAVPAQTLQDRRPMPPADRMLLSDAKVHTESETVRTTRVGPKRAGESLGTNRGPSDPLAVHYALPPQLGVLQTAVYFACGASWPRELWGNIRNVPQSTDEKAKVTCVACLRANLF
jgi:hypothetical protein